MRNKRLFVLITVMLLIAFVLSMTLMACKKRGSDDEDNKSGEVLPPPDDKDDDDEDNKPYLSEERFPEMKRPLLSSRQKAGKPRSIKFFLLSC